MQSSCHRVTLHRLDAFQQWVLPTRWLKAWERNERVTEKTIRSQKATGRRSCYESLVRKRRSGEKKSWIERVVLEVASKLKRTWSEHLEES